MRNISAKALVWLVLVLAAGYPTLAADAANGGVLYHTNFQQAALGSVPEDMLVLDGSFAVAEKSGNKALQLRGAPLDNFGVLFGPNQSSNVVVSARIYATRKGQRLPAFGIGLGGVGAYKLQVAPGRRSLDLYKGDEIVTNATYHWKPDTWTMLRLQAVALAGGGWRIEGKAWPADWPEPPAWQVVLPEASAPPAGRASVWGVPFSGTPIDFDDLEVRRLGGNG